MKNNIFNFKKKILLFCVFTILISVNGCVNKQSNVKKTDDLSMYDTRYTYIEKTQMIHIVCIYIQHQFNLKMVRYIRK